MLFDEVQRGRVQRLHEFMEDFRKDLQLRAAEGSQNEGLFQ